MYSRPDPSYWQNVNSFENYILSETQHAKKFEGFYKNINNNINPKNSNCYYPNTKAAKCDC